MVSRLRSLAAILFICLAASRPAEAVTLSQTSPAQTAESIRAALVEAQLSLVTDLEASLELVRQSEAASYVIQAGNEEGEEPASLNPVVIAESSTSVPELSVGEAVMQLEISSVPFVLFRNSKGGQTNVVYRRSDGNIGWVDPRPAA